MSMSAPSLLLDLPDVLLYHILTFIARPTDRVIVLCLQIAPLCKTTWKSFCSAQVEKRHNNNNDNKSESSVITCSSAGSGWWSLLLDTEYGGGALPIHRGCSSSGMVDESPPSSPTAVSIGQRFSKRQRLYRQRSARNEVQIAHTLLCDRTDDAHMALGKMIESNETPLTLRRIRSLFVEYGPTLRINRRSQWGRTFLIECCAANYVDEGLILRCIKELVKRHGADPNVFTTKEYPDADRPALFFAVARVMPTVVQYLVHDAGASVTMEITGRLRLVSDPTKSIQGTFTPLTFAKALKDAEMMQQLLYQAKKGQRQQLLHPYYFKKLNACISILVNADKEREMKNRRKHNTEVSKEVYGEITQFNSKDVSHSRSGRK